MATNMMSNTADSWSSWGRSTGGFNGNKTETMAATGDSWYSAGSWGNMAKHQATRLKQAVFSTNAVTAAVLSDRDLWDCFQELDPKGIGLISAKQLYKALHRCGVKVSKKAMYSVMGDMGLDPSEGIDPTDFMSFFRRAQELTLDLENERPTRCTTKLCVCLVVSAAVPFCVFCSLLVLREEDELTNGYRLGLLVTACFIFVFVSYLILAALWRNAAPSVEECCRWLGKAMSPSHPKVPGICTVNVKPKTCLDAYGREQFKSKPVLTLERSPPASYLTGERGHGENNSDLPPNQNLYAASVAAQSTNAVVCHAPARSKQPLQQFSPHDHHTKTNHHNNAAPAGQKPYNPAAYREAAAYQDARSAGTFGALQSGSLGASSAQALGTLPARAGAAKRNENVQGQVKIAWQAMGKPTQEQFEQMALARRAMRMGTDGRPATYIAGDKGSSCFA